MTSESTPTSPRPSATAGATIGPKTQIKGDLQASEDLLIEGSVSGTVVLRGNQLAVGSNGRIEGTALASTIIIDGTIEGDLYALERLSIRKGARIKGSVHSPRVSLEDGATLRGSVEMDPEAIKKAIHSQFPDLEKSASPAATASGGAPSMTGTASPSGNSTPTAQGSPDLRPVPKKPDGAPAPASGSAPNTATGTR